MVGEHLFGFIIKYVCLKKTKLPIVEQSKLIQYNVIPQPMQEFVMNFPNVAISDLISKFVDDSRMINVDPAYGSNEECTVEEFERVCDELGWVMSTSALMPLAQYLAPETFINIDCWKAELQRFLTIEQYVLVVGAYISERMLDPN
jgi:hypothetical protein